MIRAYQLPIAVAVGTVLLVLATIYGSWILFALGVGLWSTALIIQFRRDDA